MVLEAGPFWDPDEDWVSDEAGSHRLYWTEERIIGGSDPVELGKNNCGHGVGGSMVHYAGYCPRFHPSDFEVRTRDGVGEDWPISYEDLKPHYERLELELPVAGDYWPWGDPHRYPHTAHPIAGGAERGPGRRAQARDRDARRSGRDHERRVRQPSALHLPRLLPAGVQGQRQGVAARHPHPRRDRARRRDPRRLHGAGIEVDDSSGRVTGVRYIRDGRERFQRAEAVAVAGYSIETPRLLLNSISRRFPHGLANDNDQVGRCVMVQGAPQVAGRFPDEMRMYKAPPPEISSEQFYETDPSARVRARLLDPDRRAAADRARRARARPTATGGRRCASTCATTTTGTRSASCPSSCRCRRTASRSSPSVTDRNGMPVARMDYTQCENDRKNIAFAKQTLHDIFEAGGSPGRARRSTATPTSSAGAGWDRDPERSVVDSDHRAWEVPNLFIADGSVMPTQGSANPALTIMALASRLAERLDLKRAGGSGARQRRRRQRRPQPAPTRAGAG